ncbi:MAG: hypothetical protein KF863_17525 [Rubrivivax sp.]|jgi:hypothetical protein|nr:hypothetical protein [Rubrivivax sp.]
MRNSILLGAAALLTSLALAQSADLQIRDDVPIDAYLALLAQVAPPAREGAEAYMAAFRARCGRALRTVELRRAFAEGNGDPTLMAMIRATHQKDTADLQRLGASISCPGS